MGFRSVSEATTDTAQSSRVRQADDGAARGRADSRRSGADRQERFGMEMYMDGLDVRVQRLVDRHGADQVQRWADEGMTVETMGKPRDMDEFRERQAERPAEVPTDIERRNAKSVQRSRGAHHESAHAGDTQVPDSVRDVISSSGEQLDSSIQQAMEDRMGDSLGDVRIHTGPSAAKACEDINARAFTVGNHIAFNNGEYDPSSAEGQHVLAHELAHVRQQTGGAVSMLPQEGELAIDPDERLEREAEETAEQVMRGGTIGVQRMRKSEVHVQRSTQDGGSMTYEGLDSLTERVEAIESQVNNLEDEVHSGVSDKLAGGIAVVGSAAGTAGTRAAAESNVADTLGGSDAVSQMVPFVGDMMAQNPEVAAAVGLTTIISGGFYAAEQSVDGAERLEQLVSGLADLPDRARGLLSDDDGDKRDENAADSTLESIKDRLN